jgi:hypothetical protein
MFGIMDEMLKKKERSMEFFKTTEEAAMSHQVAARDFVDRWLDRLDASGLEQDLKVSVLKNFLQDLQSANGENLMRSDAILQIALQLDEKQVTDFFRGAHFVVKDEGKLYETLKPLGYERISSHYNGEMKAGPDIGINAGEVFAHLLVGKNTDGSTWFQIENTPMPSIEEIFSSQENFFDFLGHSVDTISYIACKTLPFLTPINIGQYGNSEYWDQNPLEIDHAIEITMYAYPVNLESLLNQFDIQSDASGFFHP